MRSGEPLPRRDFLKLAGAGGLALCFGIDARGAVRVQVARQSSGELAPNQWLSIDQAGVITIRAAKSEMGQGVRTALPAIVAAELGADWSHVRVVHAKPGPDFTDMGTSGSSSVPDSWMDLRKAGAVARAMLIAAAARRLSAAEAECAARDSFVVHTASNRRIAFRDLVGDAAALPAPKEAPLRPDAELTLLRGRIKREHGADVTRGRATYGIDVRVPNMRYAVLARPPVATATPVRWDEAAALRVAGVERVVRISRGLAVVAANSWAAARGRDALAVEWSAHADPGASSAAYLAALEAALPTGKLARADGGDARRAIAGATRTLQATYRFPFQAHAAIEPLSCVADVRADRCEVWAGTQRPNRIQNDAMRFLGLPRDAVVVNVQLMGGAFGRRIAIDHAMEAIELSKAIAAPVQVLWTREDDFAHDMFQAAQVNRMTAALDASGRISAWRHEVADYHLSMFGAFDPNYDPAADENPWGGFDSPYGFDAFECSLALLEAPVPTGAWRSVTYPAAVFARECFLDEVAHATGRDPLELRLAHLQPKATTSPRQRSRLERLRAVLRLAAERSEWGKPVAQRAGRRVGRGIACNPYHNDAVVAQVADVSVGAQGDVRVHRVVTAIDVGRVVDRAGLEAQVQGGVGWALSALSTQITIENGAPRQLNYNQFPILRMRDMPAQDTVIVESQLGPFGAGEPPVPSVYAAVGNAVFAATGERLRSTPLHPTPTAR